MKMMNLRRNTVFVARSYCKCLSRNVPMDSKSLAINEKPENDFAEFWKKHDKILYFGTLQIKIPKKVETLSKNIDIEKKREIWRMKYKIFYYKPLESEMLENEDQILPFQLFRGTKVISNSWSI